MIKSHKINKILIFSLFLSIQFVYAQDGSFVKGFHTPGFNGQINDITEVNGRIIIGGDFNSFNVDTLFNHIASWDGESWVPFGESLNGWVFDLTVYDSNLVAVGNFNGTGDYSRDLSNGIAMWDGKFWYLI